MLLPLFLFYVCLYMYLAQVSRSRNYHKQRILPSQKTQGYYRTVLFATPFRKYLGIGSTTSQERSPLSRSHHILRTSSLKLSLAIIENETTTPQALGHSHHVNLLASRASHSSMNLRTTLPSQ